MGSVRPAYIKKLSREIVDKYEHKLSFDFDENKNIVSMVVELQSKQLRNRVAGYVTRLMRQRHMLVDEEEEDDYESSDQDTY
ncbi:MAG: 30S ribosomal protein S17e [Promethearchaeota archaeon]